MFILRGPLAVVLSLAMTAAAVAAPNQARLAVGRRAGSGRGIQGTVVHVHHDRSPRGAGWIKIRHASHHRGRRGSASVAAALGRVRSRQHRNVMTVRVSRGTRFQRMVRATNGQSGARRTSFAALRSGERVRVIPGSGRNHIARVVEIIPNGSGARRSYGNRYASGRGYGRHHGHRRHPLVGRTVVVRRNVTIRPRVRRVVVVRPAQHPLVRGRVARRAHHRNHDNRRHTVAHHKPAKPAAVHKTAAKHTTAVRPPAHKTTASHKAHKPSHSSGHAKPHSSSHRKR